MTYDGIFLILSILILVTFIVIAYFWFKANSEDYTINQSIKGEYPPALLGQRCSVVQTETTSLLLPGYFEPQECGYNLKCVLNTPNDAYGICKSVLGGFCNNIFDCAPGATGCVGGVCTSTLQGGLFSACTTNTNQTGFIPCDSSLGLQCSSDSGGICLYQNGQTCTNSNQCLDNYCLPNNSSGPTGVCIPRIAGGEACTVDYCQEGFSCLGGVCQPTGVSLGNTGAFCTIPYSGKTPLLSCNSGLVCSFDPDTNNTYFYPGITGYGVCQTATIPITQTCLAGNNACIPTSVCIKGSGLTGYCQSPIDNTGINNVNWCGAKSTGLCTSGYVCNTNTYYCQGTTGSLCSATGFGTCKTGTCSSYKLGIFTPINNRTNINTWNTYTLPTGITISDESSISTRQTTDIDLDGSPYTLTEIIYSDPVILNQNSFNHFFYATIKTDANNVNTFSGWSSVTFTNGYVPPFTPGYTLTSIRFTKGGNFTVHLYTTTNPSNQYPNKSAIYRYFYNKYNKNTGQFDLRNPANYFYCPDENILFKSWDVDDVYNQNIVTINTQSNNIIVYYANLNDPDLNNHTFSYFNTINFSTPPVWVKSMTIPATPSIYNFVINGIKSGDTKQSVYMSSYNGTTLSLTPLYTLNQNTVNGMASAFNLLNNKFEHQLYYVSSTQFNYVDYTSLNSIPFETPINGYPPSFMTSNSTNAMSFGNLDEKLYTIVSICE